MSGVDEDDRVPGDDLFGVCADACRRIEGGVANRRAPFHTPTLITLGLDGWPAARTVVLRAFDASARTLRFHTDRRSAKVGEIRGCDRTAVHFYDAEAKVQLRLAGIATLHINDAIAHQAWEATRVFSRRCYLTELAPGQPAAQATAGLPDDLLNRAPEPGESEAGFRNFAVVRVQFDRLDWLYLAARGNRSAGFRWDAAGMLHATWRAP